VKGGPYLAQGNSGDILHYDIELVLISIHGVQSWCRDGKLLLDETQRVAPVFRRYMARIYNIQVPNYDETSTIFWVANSGETMCCVIDFMLLRERTW
jgi:hypothetical protein